MNKRFSEVGPIFKTVVEIPKYAFGSPGSRISSRNSLIRRNCSDGNWEPNHQSQCTLGSLLTSPHPPRPSETRSTLSSSHRISSHRRVVAPIARPPIFTSAAAERFATTGGLSWSDVQLHRDAPLLNTSAGKVEPSAVALQHAAMQSPASAATLSGTLRSIGPAIPVSIHLVTHRASARILGSLRKIAPAFAASGGNWRRGIPRSGIRAAVGAIPFRLPTYATTAVRSPRDRRRTERRHAGPLNPRANHLACVRRIENRARPAEALRRSAPFTP